MNLDKTRNLMLSRGFEAPTEAQVYLYASLGERGYFCHITDVLDEAIIMYYLTQTGSIQSFMRETGTEYLHQRNSDLANLIESNPGQEPGRLAFLSHLTDEEMVELCWSHYDHIPGSRKKV